MNTQKSGFGIVVVYILFTVFGFILGAQKSVLVALIFLGGMIAIPFLIHKIQTTGPKQNGLPTEDAHN